MPKSPPKHSLKSTRVNKKEAARQYNKNRPQRQDFYNGITWRRCRNLFARLYPVCIQCRDDEFSVAMPLDVVDHIIPIEHGGEPYSFENLQGLCHRHHNKKTASDKVKYKATTGGAK